MEEKYWSAYVRSRWRPFLSSLALSEQTRRELLAILIEERLTFNDIYKLSREHNLSYKEHSKLRAQVSNDTFARIKDAAPAEQYARIAQFHSELIIHDITAKFAKACADQKVTLSNTTFHAVTETLRRHAVGQPHKDPFAALAAKEVLNPSQQAIFETVLDQSYLRK